MMNTPHPSGGKRGTVARQLLRSALMCMSLCATLASAQPASVGDSLTPVTWQDQFEHPVPLTDATHVVIFVSEKPVSEWVTTCLSALPTDTLDRMKAVYVSDISAMPALITKAFALPKLRKLPFPIALARDTSEVSFLPHRPGTATWIRIQGRQVQSIQYLRDAAELDKAIAAAQP